MDILLNNGLLVDLSIVETCLKKKLVCTCPNNQIVLSYEIGEWWQEIKLNTKSYIKIGDRHNSKIIKEIENLLQVK